MAKLKMRPVKKDRFTRNLGSSLLIALIILAVLSAYSRPLGNQAEQVPLSRLVTEIENNNVDSLTVQGQEITLILADSGTELKSQKETSGTLTETLSNLGVTSEQLRDLPIIIDAPSGLSFWLATLLPSLLPFVLLAGFLWFMMRGAQATSNRALSFGQMNQNPVDPKKNGKKTTFKDVAGNVEAKQELEEVVEFLKTPEKFQKLGARVPKGVLLIGSPGTGKTLMARAVAGEAGVPFFSISGSDFVEMFVGVGASRVRDLFKKIKQQSPAILFIDELDAVGRQRGAGLGGGHDEREQTLNQILVEMDGFAKTDNVIVLAATNRPDVLDPALLRPGRFDRQVTMELPDIKERQAILEIHARNVPMSDDVDLVKIGERTPGFSGADLANLINEAAILAARNDQKQVTQLDLINSIEKVLLGPEKRSKVFSKHEKKITAYHEAGHALVAHFSEQSDPVRKISIVSRGHAGGYTLKLPEHDRHLRTRTEFKSELATLMGGYVAEMHKFNELTTGASNDLMKATKLARRIVTEWGMSSLGPVTFGQKDEYVFLGKELHDARDYSEATAQKIDEEVANLLKQAQQSATDLIKKYESKFEQLSQTLIEQETIEQAEFKAMMA